jgi:hypothetical protein
MLCPESLACPKLLERILANLAVIEFTAILGLSNLAPDQRVKAICILMPWSKNLSSLEKTPILPHFPNFAGRKVTIEILALPSSAKMLASVSISLPTFSSFEGCVPWGPKE